MPELDLNYQANTYAGMVGKSRLIHERVFRVIDQVAPIDVTVLILGETGTGKELTSRALHDNSRRKDKPYVPVHCAAIPKDLIESELYGHDRGAFTGAIQDRNGKFREANQGTLFLDEIGSMPSQQQPKLLRVLEDMVIVPVGSEKRHKVDTRVVVATNGDLYNAVREGTFRTDLYYRLTAVVIDIPPLRDRVGDIPMLIKYFMDKYQRLYSREVKPFTPREYIEYIGYSWPGNVRELENAVKSIVAQDVDKLEKLRELKNKAELLGSGSTSDLLSDSQSTGTLREQQLDAVVAALIRSNGNKAFAARDLGISRATLYRKLDTLADTEKARILEALVRNGGIQKLAAAELGISPRVMNYKLKKIKETYLKGSTPPDDTDEH